MRGIWSLMLSVLLFGVILGCGGQDVQVPEKPATLPEGEPESTAAAATVPGSPAAKPGTGD